MKMIIKMGGAMIAAMGVFTIGCSKFASSTNPNDANVATTPPANATAPVPSPPQNPEDKMPRVSVEEAKKLVEEGKAIIIDVRGTDAYKTAHVKGALDIPLNKLESADFKDLPKDKRIIAYCT